MMRCMIYGVRQRVCVCAAVMTQEKVLPNFSRKTPHPILWPWITRRAYSYHTTVKEPLRGKGIGKALLNKVYEAIRAAGIRKNGLLVIKDNEIGKGFWRSQGWEERHDVDYYSINM